MHIPMVRAKTTIDMPCSPTALRKIRESILSLPSSSSLPWYNELRGFDSSLTIQQRARLLQCQLHGRSSIPIECQVAVC